jgi:putative transposase
MIKAFQFRLYPDEAQRVSLAGILSEACRLYNAALQERWEAYKRERKSISYYDQTKQLTEIRAANDIGIANSTCARDALRRVDRAFKAFFRRVKRGEKPGYPRYRSARRYDSATFSNGFKVTDKLYVQGVGEIKIKLHRPLIGEIKTLTIKRDVNHWYATFVVEVQPVPLLPTGENAALDLGLTTFAKMHADGFEGASIENPRLFRLAEKKLRRLARRVARREKGSNRRRKAVQDLAKHHRKIRNQRKDFLHQHSHWLIKHFDAIAVEDLNVKGMSRGRLAKSVQDASWSAFINMLSYKAEYAGRTIVKVDPRDTTQRCLCGQRNYVTLADRRQICSTCGFVRDRDHDAAMDIYYLAFGARIVPSVANDA